LEQATGGDHTREYFDHLLRGNDRQQQILVTMEAADADRAGNLMLQHLLASAKDMARLLQPA
jgi:DNA-binding GntR family transcriptional regulator